MGDIKIGGLAGEEAGEGVPVVLLHGLTATRRYVVMGSKNLERNGHRVVMYDARGHGRSEPGRLVRLRRAGDRPAGRARRPRDRPRRAGRRLDGRPHDRAVRPGASGAGGGAGAHHAGLRPGAARPRPRPVGCPCPRACGRAGSTASWRPTASRACRSRSGRPCGPCCDSGCRRTSTRTRSPTRCARCRARAHSSSWEELSRLDLPVTVVASRDEADPGHPFATGERYAETIPGARLESEEPGKSPLGVAGRAAVACDRGDRRPRLGSGERQLRLGRAASRLGRAAGSRSASESCAPPNG